MAVLFAKRMPSYSMIQFLFVACFTVLDRVKSASIDYTTPTTSETDATLWTSNMTTSNSTLPFDSIYPGGSNSASIYVIIMLAVLVFLALLVLAVYLCHKGEAYRRS